MSTHWRAAVSYMTKASLASVVVSLEDREVSDGPDAWPFVQEAIGVDGKPRFGMYDRLAALVWDAAEQAERDGRLVLDGPVRLSTTGTGPVRVRREPCPRCQDRDPWSCGDCHGGGWVYLPKEAAA